MQKKTYLKNCPLNIKSESELANNSKNCKKYI